MTLRSHPTATAGTALAAVAVILLTRRFGSQALGLPVLIVAAVLLLARPRAALALAIGAVILIEADPGWGPSTAPARLYQYVPGAKITGAEVLLLIALLAALLHVTSSRRTLLLPSPFSGPLGVLSAGLVAGAITGHYAGVGAKQIVDAARMAVPVMLVPFIVVQVIDGRRALRQTLKTVAGLASFKGVVGLLALGAGVTSVAVGSQPITYYDAPANAVMLAFLLVMAAAAMMRVRLPLTVWAAVPFVAAALLLSYRRSFWIAAALGLLLIVLLATGRTARSVGFPIALAIGIAAYLAVGSAAVSQLDTSAKNPESLSGRLLSLNPTSLSSNVEDRYRIDERRNVLADLGHAPIAGLGLGVPWTQTSPLSIGSITRQYVHFGALWWWMKLGILGLIGYVWLLARAAIAGLQIWKRHPDRLIRAAGLGSAAMTVGFAVAELTASFAGSDPRMSIVFGAFLGLLSVAYGQLDVQLAERSA